MHILFPTQCMTGYQVYSGYEHMHTEKSDADFFSTSFLCLLEILCCWEDSNLEMRPLIYRDLVPNVFEAERMHTSSWITAMNY